MCKVREYPELYEKARGAVRMTGIRSAMPGYEMLIKALVIYKIDGKESLYQHVAEQSSVVPSEYYHESPKRHPVEQSIMEAMRSIGVRYDKVMTFVEEVAQAI